MSCLLCEDAVAFLKKGSSSLWWSEPAKLCVSSLLSDDSGRKFCLVEGSLCTFSLMHGTLSQLTTCACGGAVLVSSCRRDNSLLLISGGLLAVIEITLEKACL